MQKCSLHLFPLIAIALLYAHALKAEEPNGRNSLPVTPDSIRVTGSPKNLSVSAREGGGIRITYDNSDFKFKGGIRIIKKLDHPIVLSQVGFELKTSQDEALRASCHFEGGKGLLARLPSKGNLMAEYVADFAFIAGGNDIEMKPVTQLVIRLEVVQGPGEQIIELKNWWYK